MTDGKVPHNLVDPDLCIVWHQTYEDHKSEQIFTVLCENHKTAFAISSLVIPLLNPFAHKFICLCHANLFLP